MPDKVRSVDDMVADMKRAVEEPEGNTSSAKHRQHVAQAIEKLISSQIIDGKLRYIEDGTGSKAATKTAPTLLTLAAAVQEMVSEMSGRKMSYTITIEGKDAAAAAPRPTTTGKPRGRPPKDPAKKAAEAERKRRDAHYTAISEFDQVYDERKKFLDAGIGDEFAGWETDVKRLRDEQNKLDVMHEDFEAKGDEIARQLKRMRDTKKAYDDNLNHYDGLLLKKNENIVLPDINQNFEHEPNWEGYCLPSKKWCEWMDGLEDYLKMKQIFPCCLYKAKPI